VLTREGSKYYVLDCMMYLVPNTLYIVGSGTWSFCLEQQVDIACLLARNSYFVVN